MEMVADYASGQRGLTYIAVLFLIALHGTVLAAAGIVWHTAQKRENERELLFVGDQFRRAIRSYAQSGPGVAGQLPKSLDDLMQDPRLPGIKRHLRKVFVDPMTGNMEWGLVKTPDGVGIVGVYSRSEDAPFKTANFQPDDKEFEGMAKYSDWKFQYLPINRPRTSQPSQAGAGSGADAPPGAPSGAPPSAPSGAPSGAPPSAPPGGVPGMGRPGLTPQ
jgi:type II secretory pathway pseudopilin PulG